MIVEPTVNELLDHAENRFALVIAASKRAREIANGDKVLTDIALPNSAIAYSTKYSGKIKNIVNIKMEDLKLPKKIRDIFKNMLGFTNKNEDEENKEIEDYIKSIIGIKDYSFHHIQTFTKLFISQYSKFGGKIIFKDSSDNDITEKCIKNFAISTKWRKFVI